MIRELVFYTIIAIAAVCMFAMALNSRSQQSRPSDLDLVPLAKIEAGEFRGHGLHKLLQGQIKLDDLALAKPQFIRPKVTQVGPNDLCGEAVLYLVSIPQSEWPKIVFLTWHAVPADKLQPFQRVMSWWLNQLSFSQFPSGYVPLANGRIWAIHTDNFRWNSAAWTAVAEREPYMQQPLVSAPYANYLRAAFGYVLPSNEKLPVISVVRADWLFRETIETDRSTSYYDLLFAEQRFKQQTASEWRTEEKVIYHNGGDYRYPDDTGRVVPNCPAGEYKVTFQYKSKASGSKIVTTDFPANEDDWNAAFGIKDTVAFMSRQSLNLRKGAVVAGSLDDPVRGSIVARNNRVVQIIHIPTGVALKTFDAKETSGDTDYLEKAPDAVVENIQFQAGELLANLPNGGQAGLLIDGQRKRIERADTTFAHNKVDPVYVDVRTMMGCVTCHGPEGGFISPNDLVDDRQSAGVSLKINDPRKLNEYNAFFYGWGTRAKGYREPYISLIAQTTQAQGQEPWTPAELVTTFLEFRNWYDKPVTVEQAARELGIDIDTLKMQIRVSPGVRLQLLLNDRTIPRKTWEEDAYFEAMLHLNSVKELRK